MTVALFNRQSRSSGLLELNNWEQCNPTNTASFDIREYVESGDLEPSPKREKDKYLCPVCGGHNLHVNPRTGAYKCFGNNKCKSKDIREELSPLKEWLKQQPQDLRQSLKKQSVKAKPKPQLQAVPIPEKFKLLLLDKPATDTPQPKQVGKLIKGVFRSATETIYSYPDNKFVVRYDFQDNNPKGRDKTFLQFHIKLDGTTVWNKGDDPWKPYRFDEVVELAGKVEEGTATVIPWQEGEKAVELGRQNCIASLTLQGGAWVQPQTVAKALSVVHDHIPNAIHIFLTDYDDPGISKAAMFYEQCAELGLPCIVLSAANFLENPPDKADIEQILEHMNPQEFIQKLEDEIHRNVNKYQQQDSIIAKSNNSDDSEEGLNFLQIATKALYSDKDWICIDGKLHYHTGTYYKPVEDCDELSRITKYCDEYPVYDKEGQPSHPYAKPSKVKEVLQWVKNKCGIDPRLVNSQGTNFTNYVVSIQWENNKPVVILQEHSPNHYFTYEPLVEYNPNAPTDHCDRLLECLDPQQREVLLRNLAASLSLKEVRKRRSREVKIILACGQGNNGKDSIRSVVSAIYGNNGITSISLADFAHYDDGRKFALAPLMNSRINWASENPQTSRIDNIQSLKIFATGELLHAERKGKDHIEFPAEAIGVFHLNNVPSLQGTQEAIKSRIAILTFNKSYKNESDLDPNNPNEILADPRFKYDEEFIKTQVAPAFFNKMVKALGDLVEEGIDYSCTEDALKSVQVENNHLFQFFNDTGIGYKKDSSMSANELWKLLERWYINNGTLEINDYNKREWNEQVKPSDKNVKAINQVLKRVAPLFPKAKLTSQYDPKTKNTIQVISGIGINDNNSTRTNINQTRTNAVSIAVPETYTQQDFRTTRTNFEDLEENKNEENSSAPPADNISIYVKEVEAPQNGTGDTGSSHRKDSCYGNCYGSATVEAKTGTGEEAKGADPVTELVVEPNNTNVSTSTFIAPQADVIEAEGAALKLKVGDRVKYCGQDNTFKQQYGGKLLIVSHVEYGKVTCRLPDENYTTYTTWIYPDELKKFS